LPQPLLNMQVSGKAHWAWIFILDTTLSAIASFWIIEDFPENTFIFVSEAESTRALVLLYILTT
jgi:hypothetical protein